MQVEISNEQSDVEIRWELLEYLELAGKVATEVVGGDPAAEASIVLVDDEYIQQLNRTYRHQDKPTDVLSFALMEHGEEEPQVQDLDEDPLLGDVFISVQTASRQAVEYNHSLNREVVFLAVHGMLHLMGYDHMEEAERKQMRSKEDEIMGKLDLRREAE